MTCHLDGGGEKRQISQGPPPGPPGRVPGLALPAIGRGLRGVRLAGLREAREEGEALVDLQRALHFCGEFFFCFSSFFFPGSRTAKKTRRRKEKLTSFSTPSKKTPPPQFCGHDIGIHAPGRCSDRKTCESGGDSDVEPWVVSHHVLLAHSRAVAAFRALFPKGDDGKQERFIGINLNSEWAEPLDASDPKDASAAGRYLDAQLGLYAQPIFGGVSGKGDYPDSLKELVPALPKFTGEEKKALLGSADYFLLNHYTSRWVQDSPGEKPVNAKALTHRPGGASGIAIGPQAASFWLFSVPWG